MGLKIKGKSAWQSSLWVWPSLIPLKTSSRHDANLKMLLGSHISSSKCSHLQTLLFSLCSLLSGLCSLSGPNGSDIYEQKVRGRLFYHLGTAQDQIFVENIEWKQ